MRTTIMKECKTSNSESSTASIFENELYYLIRSKTGVKIDYSKEKAVNNIKHKFGSLAKRSSGAGTPDSEVKNFLINP